MSLTVWMRTALTAHALFDKGGLVTYDVEYAEWVEKGGFLQTVTEDDLNFDEVQTLFARMEQGHITRIHITAWDVN